MAESERYEGKGQREGKRGNGGGCEHVAHIKTRCLVTRHVSPKSELIYSMEAKLCYLL